MINFDLILNALFIFEGASLWKGGTLASKGITQKIEYAICEKFISRHKDDPNFLKLASDFYNGIGWHKWRIKTLMFFNRLSILLAISVPLFIVWRSLLLHFDMCQSWQINYLPETVIWVVCIYMTIKFVFFSVFYWRGRKFMQEYKEYIPVQTQEEDRAGTMVPIE